MSKTRKQEKRKFPRFPAGILLDIHAHGETVGKIQGRIVNLSVGGMAFETAAPLEEGTTLYLKINVPLEIRGDVRDIRHSSHKYCYGVRFHTIGFLSGGRKQPSNFIAAKFQSSQGPVKK